MAQRTVVPTHPLTHSHPFPVAGQNDSHALSNATEPRNLLRRMPNDEDRDALGMIRRV